MNSPLIGRYAVVRAQSDSAPGEVEGRGHAVAVADAGTPNMPAMITLLEPDGTLSRWPHTHLVFVDAPALGPKGQEGDA